MTRSPALEAHLLANNGARPRSEMMMCNVHADRKGWAKELEHRVHMGPVLIGLTDGLKWSHISKNSGNGSFTPDILEHLFCAYRECMRACLDALDPRRTLYMIDVVGATAIKQEHNTHNTTRSPTPTHIDNSTLYTWQDVLQTPTHSTN